MLEKLMENFEVVGWTPYPACVQSRFAESRFAESPSFCWDEVDEEIAKFENIWEFFVRIAKEKVDYYEDNKTVIHLKYIHSDARLYIGRYDGRISIGLTYSIF